MSAVPARLAAALVLLFALASAAFAQSTEPPRRGPLGIGPPPAERGVLAGRPAAAAPQAETGVMARAWAWLLLKQAEMNRAMARAVLQLKSGSMFDATVLLAGIAFLYGVLHAAGPGHGKAIIASYVLANERTVRRGIYLSFLSAAVQALSAIVLVGALVIAFKATGIELKRWEGWLETVSWGVVALVGAWLLWSQISARLRPAEAAGRPAHDHHHHHGHGGHEHAHHHHGHTHTHASHRHDHTHAHHHHDHTHDGACCGHAHMPDPRTLDGDLTWRKALAIAFAVGVRPCTGAIVVLVFALSQGLLWAGIFATFAMALGTAITVSFLAALAVGSRELAMRLGGGSGGWARGVQATAGIGGAALVLLMGVVFFVGSLDRQGPF
jgi:nickel/cobalt exporter